MDEKIFECSHYFLFISSSFKQTLKKNEFCQVDEKPYLESMIGTVVEALEAFGLGPYGFCPGSDSKCVLLVDFEIGL